MDRGDFLSEKIFEVLDNDTALEICGPFNNNLRYIEKSLGTTIICRSTQFKITGDDRSVKNTLSVLTAMEDLLKRGTELDRCV